MSVGEKALEKVASSSSILSRVRLSKTKVDVKSKTARVECVKRRSTGRRRRIYIQGGKIIMVILWRSLPNIAEVLRLWTMYTIYNKN
jgi:hypothetical protein